MTEPTLKRKMDKADELYKLLANKVNTPTMNLINEYVDLQLELEEECNQ